MNKNVENIYSSRSSRSCSSNVEWEANAPEEKTWATNLPFLLGCVREAAPKIHYPDTHTKKKLLGSEGLLYFNSELIIHLFPTKRSSGGLVITSFCTLIYHPNERSAH